MNFMNEVLLLQNPYILMKSSAYPLLHRQPPYINCLPFLKENLEPSPAMIFQKSQPAL